MDLQLNFEIVGTTRKYIKNHLPSDFYTKPPFCGHHQNLKSYFNVSSVEKKFSKGMSSYNHL
ncbi:hypothetical protein LEP1GSC170_0786, partial [Leptospira interrogans serovar Bataviae str. HAI135]